MDFHHGDANGEIPHSILSTLGLLNSRNISQFSDASVVLESDQLYIRYVLFILLDSASSFQSFRDYVSAEYCEENVNFWIEVHNFQRMAKSGMESDKYMRKVALGIYNQFISPTGSFPVNISDKCRQNIQRFLENKVIPDYIFQESINDIEQLICQGPLLRFIRKIQKEVNDSWKVVSSELSFGEFTKLFLMNWLMGSPDVRVFERRLESYRELSSFLIEYAIHLFDDLKMYIQKLDSLGKIFTKQNISPDIFDSLKKAFIQSCEEVIGATLTDETTQAWETVFLLMKCVIIGGVSGLYHGGPVQQRSLWGSNLKDLDHALSSSGLPLLLLLDFRCELLSGKLEFSFKEEQIQLWRELQEFHELVLHLKDLENRKERLIQKAKLIYNKYLSPSAQLIVKLPVHVRDEIRFAIENESITEDLYDEAWNRLEKKMLGDCPFPQLSQCFQAEIALSWTRLLDRFPSNRLSKMLCLHFILRAPDALKLFGADVEKLKDVLVDLIQLSVRLISNLKELIEELIMLGERQSGSEVISLRLFEALGESIIDFFEESFEDSITQSTKASWRMLFIIIGNVLERSLALDSKRRAMTLFGLNKTAPNSPSVTPRGSRFSRGSRNPFDVFEKFGTLNFRENKIASMIDDVRRHSNSEIQGSKKNAKEDRCSIM